MNILTFYSGKRLKWPWFAQTLQPKKSMVDELIHLNADTRNFLVYSEIINSVILP